MSDFLLGLGFVWAVFAPLLLLGLIAAVGMLLRKRSKRPWSLAAALVLGTVALLYGWDRWQFAALCDSLDEPTILERRVVDGILLDSSTANSFGLRYLHDEGFTWMEARDIYRPGGWRRYTREADGRITEAPIEAISATVVVLETHEQRDSASIMRTEVRERAGNRLLAHGASANFRGGRTKWLLGAWGGASCPDAGSAAWSRHYHLARNTLRPRGDVSTPAGKAR